jgi:FkbH-like protein
VKARLLSNVTIQPLAAYLAPMDLTVGEYNSLTLELLDPSSAAAQPEISHVLAIVDTEDLLGDAFYDPAAPQEADRFLDGLESFCSRHPEKIVVANTFCAGSARILTFADVVSDRSLKALEDALNVRLVQIARTWPNLLLLDTDLLFRRYGEDRLVSAAFWYAGRVRWTGTMFRALGETIRAALTAFGNKGRKVLVLDLDNTLWGGILGEVGPAGVTLSEEGAGASFRDFQRALKALKTTGVLLAICSKNNPADVDELFDTNSMMLLARDDFAAIRVNWQSKPENIIAIAQTLNLGLESFVFVDDSPVEREMVSSALPNVIVPNFPSRVELLPRWLVEDVVRPYFGKYHITAEDRAKTEQYRANEARRRMAENFDIDRFLGELDIVCNFMVDDRQTVLRASQLTQKTNQFNLTTLRLEIPDVTGYVDNPDRALVTLDYTDRFGSEGVVALALLDLAAGRIDNLLMSCRVIGRKVEDRLLERVIDLFRQRGAASITGEFIPTRKNQLASSFYDTRGFRVVGQTPDGRKTYERDISS